MKVKRVEMEGYPRREHFAHFLEMDAPFFTVTCQVDISRWQRWRRERGYPFFLSFLYAALRAANRVPELRLRIKDGGILEYDPCDASYTVALPDGTYRYCTAHAGQSLEDFITEGQENQERAKVAAHLEEDGDPLGQVFVSTVPWLSYESLEMPLPTPTFSNPSLAWGKCKEEKRLVLTEGKITEEEVVKLPVTLMVNHALADGRHVAQFYEYLEEELEDMLSL